MNNVTLPDAAGPVAAITFDVGFVIVFRYADAPWVATWKPSPVTGSDGEECTNFGFGMPAGLFIADAEEKAEKPADWMYWSN